jgi:mRNA interferase MazF
MIREGQVVLFTFPQTDQSEGRLRPALVLRRLPGEHQDWLVCMISSRLHQEVPGFDEVVRDSDPDFPGTGLRKPSVIRAARLAVISSEILHGFIGQLSQKRLDVIRARLATWLLGSSVAQGKDDGDKT